MTATKELRRKGPVVTELRRVARKYKIGDRYVGDGEMLNKAADMVERAEERRDHYHACLVKQSKLLHEVQNERDALSSDTDAKCAKYGWTWRTNAEYADSGLIELFDADGRMLGWVSKRPQYCDRGHYQVGIEVLNVSDLDGQDAFPRYFMKLERAKAELVDFLAWRLHKERAE